MHFFTAMLIVHLPVLLVCLFIFSYSSYLSAMEDYLTCHLLGDIYTIRIAIFYFLYW